MTTQSPRVEDLPEGFTAAFERSTDTFVEHVGLVLDYVSPTRVEAHLDAEQHHTQPYGILHGGVHATIVETLASVGAAANVAASGSGVVGVSNSTDFLRPHRTGRLVAVATPIHPGRTQQLWQVEIARASDDKAVARGQVRLQVVDVDHL